MGLTYYPTKGFPVTYMPTIYSSRELSTALPLALEHLEEALPI